MDATLSGASLVTTTGAVRKPVHLAGGRIVSRAGKAAFPVDLRDHLVFPGLINAHDHLQVNGVPPLPARAPFPNSYAWIEAFQQHFTDPSVVAALAIPKARRLRHGALKNLLAGVTCVAHHDPWHPALDAPDFPVALLRDYGWSYTLDGPAYGPPVQASFAATPSSRPWIIHLAEGTDAVAAAELTRLDRLGCLAANSVLVHGVGLGERDIDRVIAVGAAVVWCPGSNRRLLGRSLDPRRLHAEGRLAIGSDSRLSGARDLLEEWREEVRRGELDSRALLALATIDAARVLRLAGRGGLEPGCKGDVVIVADRGGDEVNSLVGQSRAVLRAVIRDGLPRLADLDFADWFAAAGIETVAVTLDGKAKLLARELADACVLALEPGLEATTPAAHERRQAGASR
ncbi:cytosine/adenosine deaminase-related metal-dependent hydrolase [Luteibacter jiangsuensis]|uniref:Cytosine/adenosine deaminase-related metal-dependent hydrolase n=1 Tax=Luteibacter jiangsuensis TaxID=637577 RepID=A0ABT9T1D3_9GAMM|nr:cytosine/adenosine deaminase-related metal-dependent hydrolase [Luteibacter jiangsuensis]